MARVTPRRSGAGEAHDARRRTVTDEPFQVDPNLLGAPLATVRRRAAAFALDSAVAVAVSVPLMLIAAILALWIQAPATVSGGMAFMFGGPELTEAEMATIQLDVFRVIHRRQPWLLPPGTAEAVEANDPAALAAAIDDVEIMFTLDTRAPSRYVPGTERDRLELHGDVLFGGLAGVLSFVTFFIAYFTLAGARGRPPGKWLFGIRVRRLDGAPMTVWSSFERAGGYSASLSTLGLGFFGALRDPNRQTLHDRICATVVLREPKPRRVRPALRRLVRPRRR